MSNNSSAFDRWFQGFHILGILNVTPDSFSDGGKYLDPESAVRRALQMVQDGAEIIDVGGESTRPGSDPVSPEEEMDRVIPVIERIRRESDVMISIDTTKAVVAREAVRAGAGLINDISGLSFDEAMLPTVAQLKVPVVIMHIQGKPKTMQVNPSYTNVVAEVRDYLIQRVEEARTHGIRQIIIDPGFGFGKRFEDNLTLLRHLNQLRLPGCPLMAGTSRKSFLGALFNLPPERRLEGTLISNAYAYLQGATLFRVHDVAEVHRALRFLQAIQEISS